MHVHIVPVYNHNTGMILLVLNMMSNPKIHCNFVIQMFELKLFFFVEKIFHKNAKQKRSFDFLVSPQYMLYNSSVQSLTSYYYYCFKAFPFKGFFSTRNLATSGEKKISKLQLHKFPLLLCYRKLKKNILFLNIQTNLFVSLSFSI